MAIAMTTFNTKQLLHCTACPRLVEFREQVAREKTRRFQDWTYWGKPVPGYGDPLGQLLIVGLAPARHGGNRTGRVFTGDKSADFLMKCLHKTGIANQSNSDHRNDGLILNNAYMTPVLKCVPPQDKPTALELKECFKWFRWEFTSLHNIECILALGKIAFDTCVKIWMEEYDLKRKDYRFGHNLVYRLPKKVYLVGAYHPSPRNVNTGRLNEDMMKELLNNVKGLIDWK